MVPSLRVQTQEERYHLWCGMATAGRILQDCGHDRRKFRHRTDGEASRTVGVPQQTGMATAARHGGRCAREFPARPVHLFDGTLLLGRFLHRHKRYEHGMKFNSDAKALGFQDHDILLGTDLGTFKEFDVDLFRELSKLTAPISSVMARR